MHSRYGLTLTDHRAAKRGFTLIELSIVLVIVALLIGGILVGRELISAAAARGQIAQIEKYNTAVHTFRSKYGYLPGDIPDPDASSYGFTYRTGQPGQGDGNGMLNGMNGPDGMTYLGVGRGGSIQQTGGETGVFWRDLTDAKLIDGSFSTAVVDADYTGVANIPLYFPRAKIGTNYLMVYELSGSNYYEMQNVGSVFGGNTITGPTSLSVSQAFNIDSKIDDGFPTSGRVMTIVLTAHFAYYVSGVSPNYNTGVAPGLAYAPSANTCYDNGSTATATMNYSMGVNGGNGLNCALSIKMQ